MMDIRVMSARHLLTVHSVAPIRDFLPPSIIVLGYGMDKATEILFNELPVAEFVIQSPSRLIVRVPEAAIGQAFTGIKVFSSVQVSKKGSILDFALTRPMQTLSGVDRLVQAFMLLLMTTPGSDVFMPSSGGGVQALIGRQTNTAGKGVTSDLALAIEKTKNELLNSQSRFSSMPLDEKLLDARLDQVAFDSKTGTLSATVTLSNMLGEQAEVSVR